MPSRQPAGRRRYADMARDLDFHRGALCCVPAHSFVAAVGEVDHVSGGGGVMADFGGFVAGLAGADGVDEVRDVDYGCVGLLGKIKSLGRGLVA